MASIYKCKHCIGVVHNEIAEEVAYCDITGEWMNVTLGGGALVIVKAK